MLLSAVTNERTLVKNLEPPPPLLLDGPKYAAAEIKNRCTRKAIANFLSLQEIELKVDHMKH